MALMLATSLCSGEPSLGQSGEAGYIRTQSAKAWEQLQRSDAFGNAHLFRDLEALAAECADSNWDGHGAIGVARETIERAKRVLWALPLGASRPGIGAEPDGQVTFEWYAAPKRTLSMSIAADGSLHYAALFGSSRQFGTETFAGHIPRTILDLVQRVQQA